MQANMLNKFEDSDLERAVHHTGSALQRLQHGHIFLTGGTGFFGQWLLATLIHANRTRNLEVTISVLTRSPRAFQHKCPELAGDPNVILIEGDARTCALEAPAFTHVIHAATDTSLAADANPLDLMDTIVGGTRQILDIARRSGTKDVLFVSSGAVYGGQGTLERVPETYPGACDPLNRASVYAESKRMAETLCTIYRAEYGLEPKVARAFAFAGPGLPLDAHFAIGNFIRQAMTGAEIVIKGDGTPLRSYLFAGDLAAWLLRALVLGRSGTAYNVGSDVGLSIREIANEVALALGSKGGVTIQGTPQPDAFRSRYVPCIELARKDLDVDVWTPLPDAIRATAAWAARARV